MSVEISVITCAHNPQPDYLSRVLDALKSQTLARDRWEYLLIDNASSAPLDTRFDLSWHPHARHISEPELGLTHARLRGIAKSRGEVLVFVDDDNVLDEDYLKQALKLADEWPMLGSWSGQSRPGFEEPPPEWTRRYWGNLVIRSLDHDSWSNLPHLPETMPCGAGLVVRRNVAEHYAYLHASGKRQFILDRSGDSLASAGDNDLAACACDVGLGVGLFTTLSLTHLIPASRLTESYLLRLIEGISFSGVIFRSFRSPELINDSLARRIVNKARQLRMGRRERLFFRASLRGAATGREYLDKNSSTLQPAKGVGHESAI